MLALRCRVLPPPRTSSTLPRVFFSTFTSHMPVHPPNLRPADWKSAAPSPPAGTSTFAAQSSLPKLPVLSLVPTLERLKATLVPIAHTPAELADAHRKIDAFANGIGPELQHRLEERAPYKPHWLEDWWDDGAYLSYRDSVCRSFFLRGYFSADRHIRS
jgi:Choline/Carnitine o-acyltransferase